MAISDIIAKAKRALDELRRERELAKKEAKANPSKANLDKVKNLDEN